MSSKGLYFDKQLKLWHFEIFVRSYSYLGFMTPYWVFNLLLLFLFMKHGLSDVCKIGMQDQIQVLCHPEESSCQEQKQRNVWVRKYVIGCFGTHVDIFVISNNCFLFYRTHSLITVIIFVLLVSFFDVSLHRHYIRSQTFTLTLCTCFCATAGFLRFNLFFSFLFLIVHVCVKSWGTAKSGTFIPSKIIKFHMLSQYFSLEKIGFLHNLKRLIQVKLSVFLQKWSYVFPNSYLHYRGNSPF